MGGGRVHAVDGGGGLARAAQQASCTLRRRAPAAAAAALTPSAVACMQGGCCTPPLQLWVAGPPAGGPAGGGVPAGSCLNWLAAAAGGGLAPRPLRRLTRVARGGARTQDSLSSGAGGQQGTPAGAHWAGRWLRARKPPHARSVSAWRACEQRWSMPTSCPPARGLESTITPLGAQRCVTAAPARDWGRAWATPP